MNKEVVYFIQGKKSRLVKIGRSKNLLRRVQTIWTSCLEGIDVLGAVPGGDELERSLHSEFRILRAHGEWFEPSPDLMSRIAVMLKENGIADPLQYQPKQFPEEDAYTSEAVEWLQYLKRRSAIAQSAASRKEAGKLLADSVGLLAGTIENLCRGRIAHITVLDYEAIRKATALEKQRELDEVKSEILLYENGAPDGVNALVATAQYHIDRAKRPVRGLSARPPPAATTEAHQS